MTKKYRLAALGGTFDHLHKGHRTLLDHALAVAHQITVGVTHPDLVTAKSYAGQIQPYLQRLQSVSAYLKDAPATIVELTDVYGPTLDDRDIDCLVVSPLTKSGAELINRQRECTQLHPLPIEICHLEKSLDGVHLSSTRIRQGEIDREGCVYRALFEVPLRLSDAQKQPLKPPLGKLQSNAQLQLSLKTKRPDAMACGAERSLSGNTDHQHSQLTVSVGDSTSLFCYHHHIPIDLYIFDNKIARKPINTSMQTFLPASQVLTTVNPAGTIQPQFVQTLTQAVKEHRHIQVLGEEDLTLLPCIMLFPLGTIILYGQPHEGVVVVEVSEERKEWVRRLLTS